MKLKELKDLDEVIVNNEQTVYKYKNLGIIAKDKEYIALLGNQAVLQDSNEDKFVAKLKKMGKYTEDETLITLVIALISNYQTIKNSKK